MITATPFTPPVALNGAIEHPGDVDSYTFQAKEGTDLRRSRVRPQVRSPLDPVLNIFAKNAGRVASNDDSDGPDSYLRFSPPRDGEFVISVADHLKKGGPDYTYRIEISPASPQARVEHAQRIAPARDQRDGAGGPQGKSPGDLDSGPARGFWRSDLA